MKPFGLEGDTMTYVRESAGDAAEVAEVRDVTV